MDLLPGRADLQVRQGFSFAQVFTWYTDAPDGGVFRGNWDSARIYPLGSVVQYTDGLMYAAKERNVGATPNTATTQWRALTPQDLSGSTGEMQVREGIGSSDPLLDLSATPTAGGSTLTLGNATGRVAVTLGKADTATLLARPLPYDIAITDSTGLRTPFLAGFVDVEAAVTHA